MLCCFEKNLAQRIFIQFGSVAWCIILYHCFLGILQLHLTCTPFYRICCLCDSNLEASCIESMPF